MHDPVIVIANESSVVSAEDLKKAIGPLQRQIDEHFFPLWGWRADLQLGTRRDQKPAMKVIIRNRSDEAGDLGYHFKNGLPITYTFAKDDIEYSGEFTSTLSHELLEMIADPGVNLYARGPVKVKGERTRMGWVSYEVCDPVEDNLYEIGGIKVSNFVTPEFFEDEHKKRSVKFDFLGMVDRPFQVAPGGYMDVFLASRWHTLWGRKANRKKVRHRLLARKHVSNG
jgi:hypothetical protein